MLHRIVLMGVLGLVLAACVASAEDEDPAPPVAVVAPPAPTAQATGKRQHEPLGLEPRGVAPRGIEIVDHW
jgi:hypothetical protein